MHVLDQHMSKLEGKSQNIIFIGYDQTSKSYKLYNPIKKKRSISRDVVFEIRGIGVIKKMRNSLSTQLKR